MWFKSFISWVLWVLFTLALGPVVAGVALFNKETSFHVSRFWARLLLKCAGINVGITGENNIPQTTSVFVSNHHSYVDVLTLIAYFPVNLTFVAKKTLLVLPGLNAAMWAQGHILVPRQKPSKALRDLRRKGIKAIRNGENILIFPAGERSRDEGAGVFKSGAVALAVWAKAPLVPIAVAGTREVLPRGNWPLQSGNVIISVGEPMSVAAHSLKQKNEITEKLQSAVESLKRKADEMLIENKKV